MPRETRGQNAGDSLGTLQRQWNPNIIIEGKDAAAIYHTAIEQGAVGQLDPASYSGKELATMSITAARDSISALGLGNQTSVAELLGSVGYA